MESEQECLVVRMPAPGILRMQGSDGLDLLHRISTNALADLQIDRARPTILTNALGRIIDTVTVLHTRLGPLLVTSAGREQAVAEWIQGKIFFQDDVQLEDESGAWTLIGIFGAAKAGMLRKLLGVVNPPGEEQLVDTDGSLIWHSPGRLDGYWCLLPGEILDTLGDPRLHADSGTDRTAYHALRIAAGLPDADHELAQDVTPLDVGLDDWVAFDKGCYIGQEVIARMESRQQRPKKLVRLMLSGPATPGSHLMADGVTAGILTSVALHPQAGWIGLGLLRTRIADQTRSWQADGVTAKEWDLSAPLR